MLRLLVQGRNLYFSPLNHHYIQFEKLEKNTGEEHIYSNEKNQINVTPQLKESVKLPGERSNMNAKSIKMSNYLVLKLCTGPFLCLIFIQPMSFTSSVVRIRFIVIQMIAPNLLHVGSTTFAFLSFSNIEELNVAIGKYHSFLRKRKLRNVAHFNNHSNKNYTCLCLQLKIVKYYVQ